MIILPKKNEEKLQEKAPLYSDDLDLMNDKAKNLTPRLGLLAMCHKQVALLVLYAPKTKTLELRCPQCNGVALAMHVAKRPIEKETVCEPLEMN